VAVRGGKCVTICRVRTARIACAHATVSAFAAIVRMVRERARHSAPRVWQRANHLHDSGSGGTFISAACLRIRQRGSAAASQEGGTPRAGPLFPPGFPSLFPRPPRNDGPPGVRDGLPTSHSIPCLRTVWRGAVGDAGDLARAAPAPCREPRSGAARRVT
jgi:hypothetical protein